MQPLIDHVRAFEQRPEERAGLAAGQAPEILSATCSDSRVVPALITGARPGRLFELRTAGDIAPPYGAGPPSRYHEVHTGTMRAHRPGTDAFETL